MMEENPTWRNTECIMLCFLRLLCLFFDLAVCSFEFEKGKEEKVRLKEGNII